MATIFEKDLSGNLAVWELGECVCPSCGFPAIWWIPVSGTALERVECSLCGLIELPVELKVIN